MIVTLGGPMALVSLLDVSVSFGGPPLLDRVNLQIDRGERVCLVGRNGAGKSTLMKIIAGEMAPDSGQVFRQPGAVIATLPQEVPGGLGGAVRRIVEGAGGSFEEHNDWERHDRVDRLLQKMGLPPEAEFATLSAGQKRRVLLARGLADEPALLLPDEPTNHLDLESIEWLERFLLEWSGALLFVTHDRAFLRRLATRIIEIDRGQLIGWACDYDTFLVRKQAVLEAEEVRRAQFDKKLAQEEEWIRRGVRAQRSRAQNRIDALQAMRAERKARRAHAGTAKLAAQTADRSGFKVITAEDVSFAYESDATCGRGASPARDVDNEGRPQGSPAPAAEAARTACPHGDARADTGGTPASPHGSDRGPKRVIRDFSVRIERGDKIGIIGPNGAGKTTLLRLLLGQLRPQGGRIEHGTRLEIVYFDQLRAQLDETMRVQDVVADGNATVTINGRVRHVISYLEDFLFEPDRARTPVKALSGGERNRLLLARLFTQPANVLVLDEPTNDLDAETLELLENLFVEFQGTVLLVSHDRAFLDEVCTSLLVFEGDGVVSEYIGGYDDWQREKAGRVRMPLRADPPKSQAGGERSPPGPPELGREDLSLGTDPNQPAVNQAKRPRKLTNRERAELAALPDKIEALENEQARLVASLADPAFLKAAGPEVARATARLQEIESEISVVYARWTELDG